MKPRNLIALLVFLGLLGSMAYYLYTNIERYTRQVNTGPTLNVLLNPWYAAQQFLKRHAIDSHRAMDLHAMLHRLKTDDTLVLFNDTPIYDTAQQQLLMDWMRNGGHLILTANYEWDAEEESSDDPFLDSMGVRLLYTGEDDDDKPAEAPKSILGKTLEITPACGIYSNNDFYRIHYQDDTPPLLINFGYTYTLEDANKTAVRTANAKPNSLLEYAVGKGRLTVLLDTDIWTNQNIGDFDHAFLLWHLVQDSPNVWLVASHDSENLLAVLWRTGRYLLIAVVVLLLLWSWRRWVRFGPMIPDPEPVRRRLLEHIEASTLFSWQHQQTEPLLQIIRDDIWLHLNRHHGVAYHDNNALALNKLAELSQQPHDMIQQAMTCPAPQREIHWIELISQLQTIRNAL